MAVAVAVAATVLLAGCGGGDGAPTTAATGFEPVKVGASGFEGGAPQPVAAGLLSVSKTVDGATFFGRVDDPGTSDLETAVNQRFRLAEVSAPDPVDDCLGDTSQDHLNGRVRGGLGVRFVLAEGADIADPDGIPVHVWSRGVWINGEVLARGYGTVRDDGGSRHDNAVEAEAYAEQRGTGIWNPTLCPSEGS